MSDEAKKLVEQFGVAVGTAAAPYAPAVKRMTMMEVLALGTLLQEKKRDEAFAALRDKMTDNELADETVALAELMEAARDENYRRRKLAEEITLAVLKAAFSVLLSAVLL